MYSAKGHPTSLGWGCPIRTSPDHSLLATPRGFSQPSTSFIGSWCQGIHRAPLLARRLDLSTSPSRQDQRSQKKPTCLLACLLLRSSSSRTSNLMPAQLLFDSSGTKPMLARAPVVAPRPEPNSSRRHDQLSSSVRGCGHKNSPTIRRAIAANTTIRQRKSMRLATPACG